MKIFEQFKLSCSRAVNKTVYQVKKHAPDILLVLEVGCVAGLVYTAIGAADKVDKILDDVTVKEENGEQVDKQTVYTDIGKACALPVLFGAGYLTFRLSNRKIMNDRLDASAALTAAMGASIERIVNPESEQNPMDPNKDEVLYLEFSERTSRCYLPNRDKYNIGYAKELSGKCERLIQSKTWMKYNALLDVFGMKRQEFGEAWGWTEENWTEIKVFVDSSGKIYIKLPPLAPVYNVVDYRTEF